MIRLSLLVVIVAGVVLAVPATGMAAKRPAKQLYVSLGDSYATGYQATGVKQGHNTTDGYANQVPGYARKRGYRLRLVNFGCGGATTTSILEQVGCRPDARAVGGPDYSTTTQIAAAERYIRKHRKRVGLITVAIGGNDVTKCASDPDPIACVGGAVQGIKDNVGVLAQRLRAAAGPKVPIVGITYPDVILGGWVLSPEHTLARLSVVAFQSLINPALTDAYASAKGRLVDVTAATGAYGSLDETTTLDPYGVIPVPVAKVCQLTYYCQFQDIHARTEGYSIIAQLVADTLRARRT